jgi:hypothetical protein
MIAVADIKLSKDYCFRTEDCAATVTHYAEIVRQYLDDTKTGEAIPYPFPAIYVLRQVDGTFVVVAGRHRFLAAKDAGLETIECIVLNDRKEAIRIGLESNRHHGLRLNEGDMARCIKIAVAEFSEWSNRRIADIIGCNSRYVDRIVKKSQLRTGTHVVEGKDGKQYSVQKKCNKATQPQVDTPDKTTAPDPSAAVSETGTPTSQCESGKPVQPQEDTVNVTDVTVPPVVESVAEPTTVPVPPIAELVELDKLTQRIIELIAPLDTSMQSDALRRVFKKTTEVCFVRAKLKRAHLVAVKSDIDEMLGEV